MYLVDSSVFGLTLPGLGVCHPIVAGDGSLRRLCMRVDLQRIQLDAIDVAASGLECPVVLSVAHESDYELILAEPRKRLAALHRAWLDSETKAGIGGRFVIASGLDENLYRVALVCASVHTVEQMLYPRRWVGRLATIASFCRS